ncbi:putative SNARE associated golgi family protein [Magnetofaba australis IT-1]|uniref:TVP38/TMEM64 family membrane protein n=2 Tax=Magnetofaba TaxID=1472292 RepID=A0A1Y2K4B4_9PROT|nr:putative SNARE associated golgi family protein [Magnetofaba australis IT-1]
MWRYGDVWDMAALQMWVAQFGWWAPVAFILIYAVGTLAFAPGLALTLAGGALFGPYLGPLYNLTGATIGATAAFLIARYLAADWAAQRAQGWSRKLLDGVAAEGWRFIAFVRLVPLFPFNLLNYALGLTPVRASVYVLASFVFMAPGCFVYSYVGHVGQQALSGGDALLQQSLAALALLATLGFVPTFIKRLRSAQDGRGGSSQN